MQAVKHMLCQLPVLLGILFDAVKDGRFDIGNDEPVKVVKQAAFYDFRGKVYALFFRHVA